jgi:hypothetical protein
VVAEERYLQDSSACLPVVPIPGVIRGGRGALPPMSAPPAITAKHRELRSDFLVDKSISDQLQPFRDVFEVDGVPIRDREQRLAEVFFDTKGDAAARAKEIAREGARYNLGAVERTINHPLFLAYLDCGTRSSSSRSGRPTDRGRGCSHHRIRRGGRPTLVTAALARRCPRSAASG